MKKLIKNLILLTTIFSMCFGFSAIAGIEQSRVAEGINGCECSFWELKSETPQGNYTLLQDYSEHSILVHTSQWNEYKLLVSQGSPEVIDVWGDEYSYEYEGTDYFKGFYLITGYRLKGQKNVNLPKDKYIKITDPYNCDHLSILKYLGKTLDSNTLLDVNKYKVEAESKVKEEVEKKYGTAEERAKKQAEQQDEAKADQQQIDLNNQINAELNMNASTLPYTSDFLADYCMKNAQNSQEKLLASFDNERNYVQQYLDKNGFKSISDFYNKIAHDEDLWDTGYDREGLKEFAELQKKYKPLRAAKAYIENTESGKWPSDLSYGDYLRKYLKEGGFNGWIHINVWRIDEVEQDYIPTIARGYTSKGYKTNKNYCVVIEDMYNNNVEVAKMIEADLPIIASYTHLSRYARTSLAFNMIKNSAHWISPDPMVNIKNIDTGMTTSKLIDKWVEEYLPNIKESEIALNHDEREKDNDLNDLLDPHNWKYDYETNTVKKTNKWKH